jgi:hypothetical protein
MGGVGGLAFAVSVVVQNALRAGLPANDAPIGRVLDYYTAHRGVLVALDALFPLGALGLCAFIGALVSRALRGPGRSAAIGGTLGAAGIVATFTSLVAVDTTIGSLVRRGEPDAGVVGGMWTLHAAVFGVLLASIAVALAGLSASAVAAGLLRRWWLPLGAAGALVLLVASAATPSIVDGGFMMAVGGIGFLVWVLFVVWTSVALLRDPTGDIGG